MLNDVVRSSRLSLIPDCDECRGQTWLQDPKRLPCDPAGRVSNLNRTIHRYLINSANG